MSLDEISRIARATGGDGRSVLSGTDDIRQPIIPVSGRASGDSLLGALFSPASAEQFLRDYWPERIFSAHGPRSRLPAVFQCPELASFNALAARYSGKLSFGRGASNTRMLGMQNANPLHLYEMGLSVYLPDVSSVVPGAAAFLRQLEAEFGIAKGGCRITVWASPREDGAPTHFDGEETISIQLVGTKKFEIARMSEHACPYGTQYGPGVPVFDDLYPQLENGFPEPVEAAFQTVDMKPGSVLFLPRGTWHRTTACQDSFSISIFVNPPCVLDVFLEQMRNLLLQDPDWRRPLYGTQGDHRQREEMLACTRRALQAAPGIVEAISVEDLVPLSESERLIRIERRTRFQRDQGTKMEFEHGNDVDYLQVKLWSRDNGERITLKMKVPHPFSPVFKWLAESKMAFSAGDMEERFPAVPFPQHQEILSVLTRAGFLRLLWFPALPKR